MIELYGMGSPNVLKIVLMLEELELPYGFHFVNVWKGGQFSADFLARNPNAKVPVIVDGEGPGSAPYTVFESGAILLYLAEKTGKLLPASGTARFDALQWLMVQLTGIGPMFGQHVHFSRFAPGPLPYAQSRYRTEALRLAELIEARLGQVPHLGGADYTVADVATYPWLLAANRLGLLGTAERPNIARWMEAIGARPAAVRLAAHMARTQKQGEEARAAATEDELDRVYGRGRYARAA